jgi:hypothetical protein
MPISDVANVSISVSGAGPTRAGFGEPLIATYNPPWGTNTVREYSSLAGMVADGFAITHPAYLCAQAIASQNPVVTAWKVGRRASAFTQVTTLTLLSVSALDTYVLQLRTPGGALQTVTMASTGVPATDVLTMNTAVTALGIAHLTATHATTILTLTMSAGFLLDVLPGPIALMTFADTTADPGIAADLTAIQAADNAWYGLLLDSQSPSEITATGAWAEANGPVLFVYNSSDTACTVPGSTTDIFYTQKAFSYARSAGIFSQSSLLSYRAAAWMGALFPTDAGSENWAMKTLVGQSPDTLNTNQQHAIENKNASIYTRIIGQTLTLFGKQPGGNWIDITRGIDSLVSDLQADFITLEANSKKIPFTDAGIDMFRGVILAELAKYTARRFLTNTPPQTVSMPLAASFTSAQRATRSLTGCSFTSFLAGAIDSIVLTGTLTQ